MTTGANNYKPFAVGGSANAITQAAYEALTTLIANGFLDGVADSAKVNKVLRQASMGSAVLGEIIAANGADALDDGDVAAFKTKLISALNSALSVGGGPLQNQTYTAFTTGGASGTFTLTPSPAVGAYAANQRFRAKFHTVGNGTDTINVSGLGAKNIKQYDGAGAKVAPVITANQLADIEYDGTDFVILNPLSLPVATISQTKAGASSAVAITPADLLGAIGFSAFFESAANSYSSASLLTLAHGLTRVPKLVQMIFQCITAEHGYSPGDQVFTCAGEGPAASRGTGVYADSTNVYVRVASTGIEVVNKSTGAQGVCTAANWAILVRAWG